MCFCGNILPLSENYVNRYFDYRAVWQETDAVLDRIPDDASVTATTFLVVPLSRRAVLYDLRYCSQEHLLSTDYVVVETTDSGQPEALCRGWGGRAGGPDGSAARRGLCAAAGIPEAAAALEKAVETGNIQQIDLWNRFNAVRHRSIFGTFAVL